MLQFTLKKITCCAKREKKITCHEEKSKPPGYQMVRPLLTATNQQTKWRLIMGK